MFGLKVIKKDAQKVKNYLLENLLYDKDYLPKSDEKYIFFPLSNSVSYKGYEVVDVEFNKSKRKTMDLREALQSKLSDVELNLLKTAFDTVGDIAILEIDEDLFSKEKMIAQTLLDIQPSIKVVCRKEGIHGGTFRTQKMKILAGENRLETIHTENGVKIKLNVEEVYFSPRLSTERKRINKLVKKDEDVLVMFSGSGVYPLNIAKNTFAKHIVGVEINPKGHEFAQFNKIMNKVDNVDFYNGDVNDILPKLKENSFDRIFMPLPKSAEDFLDIALTKVHEGTIIHFYDFLHEDNFADAHNKIKLACEKNNLKYKILETVKCGQHAPRVYRICVDFKII